MTPQVIGQTTDGTGRLADLFQGPAQLIRQFPVFSGSAVQGLQACAQAVGGNGDICQGFSHIANGRPQLPVGSGKHCVRTVGQTGKIIQQAVHLGIHGTELFPGLGNKSIEMDQGLVEGLYTPLQFRGVDKTLQPVQDLDRFFHQGLDRQGFQGLGELLQSC